MQLTSDLARLLCAHIDWQHPGLAQSTAAAAYRAEDFDAAAVGFVRYLRGRETPRLGYTKGYVRELRAQAPAEQSAAARERLEAALGQDLLMPYHRNAFAALGAETILLAATPELCRRMADRVRENQPRWADGFWGVTHSVCDLLRFLWPLEECADEDLIPLFCWLLTKAEGEWVWARSWDENTLGTSGHNWWAHTFLGFWMLGLCFPELQGMGRFAAFVPEYLERELGLLFEDDGWSKEGSPGYHDFAVENLLLFAHLAELNGITLSEATRQRLRVIADAGWRLLAPDGDYPVFGDAVRASQYAGFHAHQRPDLLPCTVLRRRAARFSLPEAKFVAEALNPDWQPPFGELLPDDGLDLLPTYRRLPAISPTLPDACLRRSGLYAMRQNWTPQADYAALIAGALGPRITSHKHADLFAFELYSRGRRLLVDNWYGSVAEEREDDNVRMWRVSSAAHNVATVDGQDHVPIVREFLYGATVLPLVDDWRSTASYAYFSGVHEGYLRVGVSACRRKLFYLRGGYWILIDRFTAETDAEHTYQLHFHLNAPATLQRDSSVITHGDGGNLLIMPVAGENDLAMIDPNPYPIPGYENPAHLSYTRRTHGNDLFVTLLVPFVNDDTPKVAASLLNVTCDERTLSPWEATALRITINGREDVYFDQHMQWNLPWSAGGYTGSGRLFHSQCE